ncbi:ABC transporter permease subunit [Craurococcus roseus]|uniref:ABC transporter permease subunit n=1 Tax=Craurococcus roseus TaxID=77585 RepID=A0ABP3RD22_9PROT
MSGASLPAGATATAAPSAQRKIGSIKRERRWALIGAYVALAVFVLFFLVPPFHMLMTSLKSSAEIADLSGNPWIVSAPTLENYRELLTQGNYVLHFRNSVIVTLAVVAITMVISTLAAFSLARMRFWGSATLATGVFLTYLVPETLLFIPLFQIIGGLGLYNNLLAMILIYPTLTVPFCTWIMIGYFSSIPKELDEAALIDGANHFQMLWKIFIPVALPGILAATIFAFTVSWAQFLYPMAFLVSSDQMVLTVGIVSDLIRGDTFAWGKIMAGALMAAAPPLLVYAFLMDYYIAGLTAGATKG